jgi:DNA modification methylase
VKPYYQDDFATIYHGDCREVTEWLDADVLVTDPPYGTGAVDGYGRRQNHGGVDGFTIASGVDGFTIANDATTDTRDDALLLWGERPACVFGSPRLPDPPIRVADRLVWDKKRPGMNGGPWRYRHESIYVTAGFVRVDDSASSVIAEWPGESEHVHAKPLPLMLRLVAAAPPGIIADPFMGSGSTLRAAKDLGRKCIGVELEERYCEIAANRLAQEVLDFGGAA